MVNCRAITKVNKTAIGISFTAFVYYLVLCAKEWTWVFVSGDSGDWLACANWWMVPQPYGSPLYILLCRLVGLFPGNLAFNVTWVLSVAPAAISVGLVYLIVKHLTGKNLVAIVSSLILLGATVFLTQATVVEEYALATMFVTLSIYFRVKDRPYLTALCVGLGIAVHVIVLIVALVWLIAELRYWRTKLRAVTLSGVIVAVFYSFILALMAMDTPKLLAGGLNLKSVTDYLGAIGGSVVGQLSIFEFPKRLWDFVRVILASLSLAIVPIVYGIKYSTPSMRIILLGPVFVLVGYYLTCLDYSTWTFLTLAMPALAVLAGIGLNRLQHHHTKIILTGCVMLIVLNSVFMNANVLTKEYPIAREYYTELTELPQGSVVLAHAGSFSLGAFYAMSEGAQIIPLVYPYLDWWKFEDYRTWMNDVYNLDIPKGTSTLGTVQYFLEEGKSVYYANYPSGKSEIGEQLVLGSGTIIRRVIEVQECLESE